ncbi:MFS transporter [Alcaligenes sp. Marseille-Q7550]
MTPARGTAKSGVFSSLFLVLTGVCAALHIWKVPPALPAMQRELGLDLVQSGFLLSSVQTAGMLLGLLIGLVSERVGLRRCILVGLGILSLTSLAAPFFDHGSFILLSRAVEGCGFLMVVLPVPALIKRTTDAAMLSRIMGLWGCYMPAGAVLMLWAGAAWLSAGSWRVLWLALAALTFTVLLLTFWLVPRDPARAVAASGARPVLALLLRETLGSGRVWLVALSFGVYAAQWAAVVGFMPTIYNQADISVAVAGLLTAVIAGGNVIGNLGAGRLLHAGMAAYRLLQIGFLSMMGAAVVAFGLTQDITVQFVAVLLFSITGGLIPATLFFLAVTVAPSPQTTSSSVGWVQQCSSLGQFVGPPVVAWSVKMLGGWQWAWVATAGFAIVGLLMSLRLARLRPAKSV